MSQAFRRKLKDAREKLGLSQSKMAAKLGVPTQTLQAWEADRNTPDKFKLEALGRLIDQLLGKP